MCFIGQLNNICGVTVASRVREVIAEFSEVHMMTKGHCPRITISLRPRDYQDREQLFLEASQSANWLNFALLFNPAQAGILVIVVHDSRGSPSTEFGLM